MTLLFSGCTKDDPAPDPQDPNNPNSCAALNTMPITANGPVTIGNTLKFSVPDRPGYTYTWFGPWYYSGYNPSDSIWDASLKNEGWYYVRIDKDGCTAPKYDSVYIDVKLKQGNPPCTATLNTATYSLLFDDTFTSIDKSWDPGYGVLTLNASGNGVDLDIIFHPHWNTIEPEDGIYYTTNVPTFDQVDPEYNKVFASTVKQSIYWSTHADQPVYVSHVNGKLQVRYCNINMSGYNGTSYFTTATANVLEQ